MNTISVNQRAESVKNDEEALNIFVEDYKPFIASCVEKSTGRYVRYGEDDELSIALMAFVEAIRVYESKKGGFLSFAQGVIHRRLIDYYRKEKKHKEVVYINEYYTGEEGEEKDLSEGQAIENYSKEELNEYRKLEIEELKKELSKWEISFMELAEASPKHDRLRKMCMDIVNYILSCPEIVIKIKEKKYLPVADIEKALKISRKKIERSRKYIIAVILIKTGEYQYLNDFVRWG